MTYDLSPFNSILAISRRWKADDERMCAVEPRLRLRRFPPPAGLEPGSLYQQASA